MNEYHIRLYQNDSLCAYITLDASDKDEALQLAISDIIHYEEDIQEAYKDVPLPNTDMVGLLTRVDNYIIYDTTNHISYEGEL